MYTHIVYIDIYIYMFSHISIYIYILLYLIYIYAYIYIYIVLSHEHMHVLPLCVFYMHDLGMWWDESSSCYLIGGSGLSTQKCSSRSHIHTHIH